MTAIDGAPDVPWAWLCAQETAQKLIGAGGVAWPQASFEYRATHDVLSLTSLLSGAIGPAERELVRLRALVDDDVEWAVWCESRLGLGISWASEADLDLAAGAWRWLTGSRLLGGSLRALRDVCGATAMCRGVGLSVGVAQARRLLDDDRLARCHQGRSG